MNFSNDPCIVLYVNFLFFLMSTHELILFLLYMLITLCRLGPSFDLKRSSSESLNMQEDELKYSRRGSGTVRRSFFKRKKHQRTNSRDSRDLSSFSEISLNADSLSMSEGKLIGSTPDCNSFLLKCQQLLTSLGIFLKVSLYFKYLKNL